MCDLLWSFVCLLESWVVVVLDDDDGDAGERVEFVEEGGRRERDDALKDLQLLSPLGLYHLDVGLPTNSPLASLFPSLSFISTLARSFGFVSWFLLVLFLLLTPTDFWPFLSICFLTNLNSLSLDTTSFLLAFDDSLPCCFLDQRRVLASLPFGLLSLSLSHVLLP